MNLAFEEFTKEIDLQIMDLERNNVRIIVLPEYCWRLTPMEEVMIYINTLKTRVSPNLILVLGTLEFVHENRYTNNCMILHNNQLSFVPKTKVLAGEVLNNVVSGNNPGVFEFEDFKMGVLICADLWEPMLLKKLVIEQKADIIVVPAWTGTIQGNREIARLEWHSLAKTTSTQYSVVVAVADHALNMEKTDVGNATVIFSPSNRGKKFPTDIIVTRDIETINFDSLKQSRNRWKDKGLAPL